MKVGLALGGGSVKGLAHIGVLKVLEKYKIKVDYLAGTSIGSVVAGLYGSGMSVREIEKLAIRTKWKNLLDFTVPREGLLIGEKIENYLRLLLNNKRFEDLSIPTRVVAVDLSSGSKVVFKKGDVARAIHASIAIPSVFVPVKLRNMVLVDGGIIDPVPISVVKEMGADIIIAVDLSQPYKKVFAKAPHKSVKGFEKVFKKTLFYQEVGYLEDYLEKKSFEIPSFVRLFFNPVKVAKFLHGSAGKLPDIVKIALASNYILVNELTKKKMETDVDVAINPEFKSVHELEFTKAKYIINRGEVAAKKRVKEIKKFISRGNKKRRE